eukprot:scpid96645/ scgid35172/ 
MNVVTPAPTMVTRLTAQPPTPDTDDTDMDKELRIIQLALGRAVAPDAPTIKSKHTVIHINHILGDTDSTENTPPVEVDTHPTPVDAPGPDNNEEDEEWRIVEWRIVQLALSRLG